MVRAAGSYPAGRRFDSTRRYQIRRHEFPTTMHNDLKRLQKKICLQRFFWIRRSRPYVKKQSVDCFGLKGRATTRPHGQAVKTPPFHGGIMGSNPVGVTTDTTYCKSLDLDLQYVVFCFVAFPHFNRLFGD